MEPYAVRAVFNLNGREPITESEFRKKEAEARAELIPIDECAMLDTEYHHAWDDADYETGADGTQWSERRVWHEMRRHPAIGDRICTPLDPAAPRDLGQPLR